VLLAAALAVASAGAIPPAAAAGNSGAARVLRVGTWHGRRGDYATIQAAVNAAKPGDWILIAPGDYHESPRAETGVLITTPNIHLLGADRNAVIVDGTQPGAPGPCASDSRWQNVGSSLSGSPAGPSGRNGIIVKRVSGVSIDNLTVCNFVGHDTTGMQIAFDGGFGTSNLGLGAFEASFLTATSTSASPDRSEVASWGIFVSNSRGPGTITNSFASNMADSGFHIGGCSDCNTVFDHDTAEHNVIGFGAINAGGRLRVERSTFTDNAAGIDLASEQDLSAPPPQDGSCPSGETGPLAAHPSSCTAIDHNLVADNNDPNVPGGSDRGGTLKFIGAGVYIAGGRNDAVTDNTVHDQGSYGIVAVIYPWTGPPASPAAQCQGGDNLVPNELCLFNTYGNVIANNALFNNGSFDNPTNGDLADAAITHEPGNCFIANTNRSSSHLTVAPVDLQQPSASCSPRSDSALFGALGVQIACATQALGPCENGNPASALGAIKALAAALHGDTTALNDPGVATMPARYPAYTSATAPRARRQSTIASPCRTVPTNPWCGPRHP
jgi:hypothetical protein